MNCVEDRDRQLSLSFGDDCGRQESGRFGPGNDCASDGGSPSSGARVSSLQDGEYKGSDIDGLGQIDSLVVRSADRVKALSGEAGIKDIGTLLEIGIGNGQGAETRLSSYETFRYKDQQRVPFSQLRIESDTPIDPNDAARGKAEITVMIEKTGDADPVVHYGFFQRDDTARQAIEREKENSGGTGASRTESILGAAILDRMLTSLESAKKAGIKKAVTEAAGYPGDSTYQGYRLWGRFGFDSPLAGHYVKDLQDEFLMGRSVLSKEHEEKITKTNSLSLQELISTKEGEQWWKKHGGPIDLTLDFTDKESLGYKRFETMLSRRERAKARGSRSYLDFLVFASRSDVSDDLSQWSGFVIEGLEHRAAEVRDFLAKRNCGTGAGGFQKGNTCAGAAVADVAKGAAKGAVVGASVAAGKTAGYVPAIATGAAVGAAAGAVKGLYDNKMTPTNAAKMISKVGTSDEKVASLVKSLGGSPKSIAKADGKSTLSLSVKDGDGKGLFDVRMTSDSVTISPSAGRETLTKSQVEGLRKIAEENSPRSVKVVVNKLPTSTISKIVKSGFSLAHDAALGLVAGLVVPTIPAIAGTVVEGATGFDIEASGVVEPVYKIIDKVADKVIH